MANIDEEYHELELPTHLTQRCDNDKVDHPLGIVLPCGETPEQALSEQGARTTLALIHHHRKTTTSPGSTPLPQPTNTPPLTPPGAPCELHSQLREKLTHRYNQGRGTMGV